MALKHKTHCCMYSTCWTWKESMWWIGSEACHWSEYLLQPASNTAAVFRAFYCGVWFRTTSFTQVFHVTFMNFLLTCSYRLFKWWPSWGCSEKVPETCSLWFCAFKVQLLLTISHWGKRIPQETQRTLAGEIFSAASGRSLIRPTYSRHYFIHCVFMFVLFPWKETNVWLNSLEHLVHLHKNVPVFLLSFVLDTFLLGLVVYE